MVSIHYQTEQTVEANGLSLAYDAFGNRRDPAVILISGLGTQLLGWEAGFCELLAQQGYWVIRFDNRDIGRSTYFTEAGIPNLQPAIQSWMIGKGIQKVPAPYTIENMALDVVGLMDALQIESAHLVGGSMGGIVAQVTTIEHPGRVKSLTCICSTSGDPSLPLPRPEALQFLLSPPPTSKASYIEHEIHSARVLHEAHYPPDDNETREKAEKVYARGLNPAGSARQLAAVSASVGWKARLPEITTPTLVIHGTEDPLLPYPCGQDIANTIPNATLLTLENAGHTVPKPMWPEVIGAIAGHCG